MTGSRAENRNNELTNHPKKILIFQEAWGRGGVESFVMGLLKNLDPKLFDVELMSAYDWYEGFDEEIAELGATRTAVFPGEMPGHIKRLVYGTHAWRSRLNKGDVDIVHVNAMNGITLIYVFIAKLEGISVRIAHSHNSSFSGGARQIKAIMHRIGRSIWSDAATQRLACSEAAALYLFGNSEFKLICNGIDTNRFCFNQIVREARRRSLGIEEGAFLFGSIGRLSYQKNPLYSLDVLNELISAGYDCRLLLVGDGELENELAIKASKRNLTDHYIHIASVPNPEAYYCALDAFILPSRFEGLPYSVIEAQCSGLPIIASYALDEEACITDLVTRIPLDSGPTAWSKAIATKCPIDIDRTKYAAQIDSSGFSVKETAKAVFDIWNDCDREAFI